MESKKGNNKQQQTSAQQEDKQQSRNRYDHLRKIELEIQDQWKVEKTFETQAREGYENMSFEEKNATKFMTTFPYPYMNGYLHLGHAFTLSKCEFQARYQKQIGKNSMFPFAFHCTGMPIQAASFRLKREIESGQTARNCQCTHATPEKKCPCPKIKSKDPNFKQECNCKPPTQYEILQSIGIANEEIPKFQDPIHWLQYFPPQAQADLQNFGLMTDWRRSFITTEISAFYDSYIQWQFNILKSKEKLRYGKRYTIFSALDNQPCADHDRSKGEGVNPQEYTIIKLKVLEAPAILQEQFKEKTMFLVAATLRTETMYGQTNCYVLPEGEYGVFEMQNDEYYICSERSARNMAYQNMTKEFGKYPVLAKVTGQDLIGTPLSAPLAQYEVVYALPMQTISMTKGTGVVTSVPSDAPDDWAALRDLQTRSFLREKYHVKDEWCMPFQPVPIIEIPEFGNLAAVKIVDEMKIQSQNQKDKLAEAKDKVYLKGFYEGKMIIGQFAGAKVQDAKPLVRKYLIDNNQAAPYYEPENEVVSRTGDQCVVALCDQWFLTYGEESWKSPLVEHVKSENFQTYNPKTKHEFVETLDWLKEWACSRTLGLGTRLPWDKQFVIESLSDSTIYMAFYTISHLLQGSLDGSKPGPYNIQVSDLTDEVWNYIFLKGNYPQNCKIPEEVLQKLRYEFEYWYPMDLRCSGKDLIRNHLTFSLYNHSAVWENQNMLPRGFFCNGYLLINGKKMSKSEGNFLTLRECIEKYGVDATRLTLADSGDSLDDANFEELVANKSILRLFTFEKWITDEIKRHIPEEGIDFSSVEPFDLWDKILENEINNAIDLTTADYKDMKFKQALKHGFFEIQGLKEDYLIGKKDKANPHLLLKFIETQLILINPICPHFAEYCWQKHVYPALLKSKNVTQKLFRNLSEMGWPTSSGAYDPIFRRMYDYLKEVKSNVNVAVEKAQSGGKKNKGGKQKEEEKKVIENCSIFVALEYPAWQKQVIETISQFQFDENNKIVGNHIPAIQKIQEPKKGVAMKFAAFLLEEAAKDGKDKALEIKTPFDEVALINENKEFIFENMNYIKNIKVRVNTDESEKVEGDKNARENCTPSKPQVYFY